MKVRDMFPSGDWPVMAIILWGLGIALVAAGMTDAIHTIRGMHP